MPPQMRSPPRAVMIPERVAEMGRVGEAVAEGDFFDLDVPLATCARLRSPNWWVALICASVRNPSDEHLMSPAKVASSPLLTELTPNFSSMKSSHVRRTFLLAAVLK